MDRCIEQTLAPTLGALAVTRILLDVGDHTGIENARAIVGRIKAAIEIEIGTSEVQPDLFGHLLQRKRWQISSSEAPTSCLSSSRANNTRVGMGARPRGERLRKRVGKLCSTAATSAAQGKESAHWRMGCVSGTKSATCRRGPAPPNQC